MNKTIKVTAMVLSFIVVFLFAFGIGQRSGFLLEIPLASPSNIVVQVAGGASGSGTAAPASASSDTPATPAAATDSGKKGGKSTDAAPAADPTEGAGSSAMTKAEIVDLFKTSANKIKTDAKTVTRNYEDLQHNEEKLEVPSALKSIGSSLISTFLKKDETPVNYSGQEIIDNYPVKGQSYVTNLTENDVTEATITDDGTYYNITLKFPEETDPTSTGVATSFNIIKADEVYAAASVVKNFNATYYDAFITCQIEKSTGNMVHATYTLPIVMKVTAGVAFATLDAQVGMTFIDDYSIAY